jgi:hypothetical protein
MTMIVILLIGRARVAVDANSEKDKEILHGGGF